MNKQHLYFIHCELTDKVKIGVSNNVRRRLAELQLSSPTELKLIGVVDNCGDLEKTTHFLFRKLNTKGEWFEMNEEIRTFMQQLQHNYNLLEPDGYEP